MTARAQTRIFGALSLTILLCLLGALGVAVLGVERGLFTDYLCGLMPLWLVPANAVLLVVGLVGVRTLRCWVLVPGAALVLSLCFRDSVLFWLLGGYVPGR